MDRTLWTSALIGFLAPVALLAPFNPAEAGLLDWLFGRRAPAVVETAHPDLTLSPRKKKIVRRPAPAPAIDPKTTLARTIDPVKNPNWWRVDPTLKRGDILFLNDRVVVFVGSKPGDSAGYVPVSRTRLISAKERRSILAMAGRGAEPAQTAARPKRARFAALR